MKSMGNLAILLLILFFVNGCIQQAPEGPCSIQVAEPGELEDVQLVSVVEDPRGDFIMDHPFFERTFDLAYPGVDAIPAALDIVRVNLERKETVYSFQIFTATDTVPQLLEEGVQLARFGVFVDLDLNGTSDILLTTVEPERGVVVTSDFDLIEEMSLLTYDSTSVTISASAELLGDHFDWVAFTAYSPKEGAYYQTPLEDFFFVPEVDLAYADTERRVLAFVSVSNIGNKCKVTDSGIATCPPRGNPPGRRRVPGSFCKGWLLKQKQCGNLKIELWCNCSSGGPPWTGGFFGKRIEKGLFRRGWVAKCPFKGGQNSQVEEDVDNDGIPDKVYHASTDMGHDDDGDGYLDTMVYVYDFRTNLVSITNIERDYHTGEVVNRKRFLWGAVLPFVSPEMVPGSVL